MAYGFQTYDETGALRLSITDKTVFFSLQKSGSGDDTQAVEAAPSGMTRILSRASNVDGGTISFSGNDVVVSGYSGRSYNYTVYML